MISLRLYTVWVSRRSPTLFLSVFIALVCLFQMSVMPTLTFAARERNQTNAQENGGQVTSIEPGKPVERELQGGEKHTYEIHTDAGLCLHAVVEQLGIDVNLT